MDIREHSMNIPCTPYTQFMDTPWIIMDIQKRSRNSNEDSIDPKCKLCRRSKAKRSASEVKCGYTLYQRTPDLTGLGLGLSLSYLLNVHLHEKSMGKAMDTLFLDIHVQFVLKDISWTSMKCPRILYQCDLMIRQ